MREAFIAFFGMVALDFVFTRYTMAVATQRPWWASGYAAGCLILQGGVILSYVHDPIMLIPAAAGAFAGTYLAMRRQ